VADSGGRPRWAYAVIRQREHLDIGTHEPLYPQQPPRPGPKCVLLPRITRADTYGPGCPVPVPAYGRPLPDMGGEPTEMVEVEIVNPREAGTAAKAGAAAAAAGPRVPATCPAD